MFRSLHTYRVYVRPNPVSPFETAEFVRDGFSFWALVFNIFWLMWNRIWLVATVFATLTIINILLRSNNMLSVEYSAIIDFGIAMIIAVNGFDWYAEKLERNGYELYDIVSGKSLEEAQRRFFDRVAITEYQDRNKENPIALLEGVGW